MRVQFDKRKAAVSGEALLGDHAEVLEEWNYIVWCGVGSEIPNVASSLPLGGLRGDSLVTACTVGGELVMTELSCRGKTHGRHGLLLRQGRLALLIGPIATDSARTEPLPIHPGKSLFCIVAIAEGHESVSTRATCLHIPHHTSLGDMSVRLESLLKNFIVNLVGKITDEDMVVIGSVFLRGRVGLVCVVDANVVSLNLTTMKGVHGALGDGGIVVFNESIVETFCCKLRREVS